MNAPPLDVVVSERTGALGPNEARITEQTGATVRNAPLWSLDLIREHAASADIILVGAVEPFAAEALEAITRCKAIVRRGAGYDNIDVEAATRLGIVVANVPDASVEEVSDHALALLLALERRVCGLDGAVRAGLWAVDPTSILAFRRETRRLRELNLVVIGFGRIGQALARKAQPLYAAVLTVDPVATPGEAAECGVRLVSLDDALAEGDHFSLHVPLLPETRHLISRSVLARMREGAVLVNTARGELVDEEALVEALRSGRLAAAGLDVTAREPLPPDDPLLATNALITAHSASWSPTARAAIARRSVDEAIRIASGRLPSSIVNRDVLDRETLRLREVAL